MLHDVKLYSLINQSKFLNCFTLSTFSVFKRQCLPYLSIYLFLSYSNHPSFNVSFYLSIYLSSCYIYLSIYPSLFISIYLSINLSVGKNTHKHTRARFFSLYTSIYQSIHLSRSLVGWNCRTDRLLLCGEVRLQQWDITLINLIAMFQ